MKKNNHIAISIKGTKNKKKKTPCEDFFVFKTFGNKKIGIVSDGAGSAKFAKIGAMTVCNTLVDCLKNATITNVEEKIVAAINTARQKLVLHRFNKTKSEKNLRDFSATVIGFFYYKNKGIIFHIGDGAAIGLDAFYNDVISSPHNGYFSCETFFYTMDNWKSNLRFVKCNNLKYMFLLTDGISPFALDKNKLRDNFVLPINDFLASDKTKTQKLKSLEKTFDNEKVNKLNSDDKTILWCEL